MLHTLTHSVTHSYTLSWQSKTVSTFIDSYTPIVLLQYYVQTYLITHLLVHVRGLFDSDDFSNIFTVTYTCFFDGYTASKYKRNNLWMCIVYLVLYLWFLRGHKAVKLSRKTLNWDKACIFRDCTRIIIKFIFYSRRSVI